MYQFLCNMWIMRRIDELYLNKVVDRKWITEEEKDMILATPQMQLPRIRLIIFGGYVAIARNGQKKWRQNNEY